MFVEQLTMDQIVFLTANPELAHARADDYYVNLQKIRSLNRT